MKWYVVQPSDSHVVCHRCSRSTRYDPQAVISTSLSTNLPLLSDPRRYFHPCETHRVYQNPRYLPRSLQRVFMMLCKTW